MMFRIRMGIAGLLAAFWLVGCVSQVYQPGSSGHPFNKLKLGQGYGDMVRELGKPSHSHAEDRTGQETAILFVPGWNLVESAGDFNPSSVQVYAYDRLGTITIGNNRILRIEAQEPSGSRKP